MPQKDAEYVDFQTRLNTFEHWPASDIISPNHVAAAGFFYLGQNDSVKCFSCGGCFRNWQSGDDPWALHAETFHWCDFVLAEKGQHYIDEHKRDYAQFINDEPEEGDVIIACKVCNERSPNTALMPCAHLVSCNECAGQLTHCVVCGVLIKERIQVHTS